MDGGCVTCLTCIRIVIRHLDRPPDRPPDFHPALDPSSFRLPLLGLSSLERRDKNNKTKNTRVKKTHSMRIN